MPVVVIANPKGGVGKSTLATNVAGYWASQGHAVMLGDVDRQQSSRLWLGLRPPAARPITSWEVQRDAVVRPPKVEEGPLVQVETKQTAAASTPELTGEQPPAA